jgi:hypothetical protein
VTKDKKDRRDYEHIQVIVKQLGLHSQMYGKVVVISKTPLPNYRPDLDDRRPQRQVRALIYLPISSFSKFFNFLYLNFLRPFPATSCYCQNLPYFSVFR